jgi:signal peptidase I
MAVTKKKSIIREYVEALVVAIILALVIRTFVIQAFKIPSGSMLETLQIGDHVLVNKFIYTFSDPKRGDIIVFKYPEDQTRDFIKRIVGLPGETLEIKNRVVYINKEPLKEDYVKSSSSEFSTSNNLSPRLIPPDSYFVMGDNRDNSMDSRVWGFLKHDLIRGKSLIIYFSIAPSTYNDPSAIKQFIFDIPTIPTRIRWKRFGKMF